MSTSYCSVRTSKLPRPRFAKAGFVFRHVKGIDMFLDGPKAKARDAVHIIFAGERVRSEDPVPAPEVGESEAAAVVPVVPLESLVKMKLTSFRDKDRTHLRDMIDVGLIDESWLPSLPAELAARFNSCWIARWVSRAPHPRSMAVPSRAPAADEAFEDQVADLVGRAIRSDALRNPGHLLDEVDEAEIEVIFDQREARDTNARIGTIPDLGQRVRGRLLGGGVDRARPRGLRCVRSARRR